MNLWYFIFIGWWLGALWFTVGILLSLTIVLWPAGMAMVHKTPEMMFGT